MARTGRKLNRAAGCPVGERGAKGKPGITATEQAALKAALKAALIDCRTSELTTIRALLAKVGEQVMLLPCERRVNLIAGLALMVDENDYDLRAASDRTWSVRCDLTTLRTPCPPPPRTPERTAR